MNPIQLPMQLPSRIVMDFWVDEVLKKFYPEAYHVPVTHNLPCDLESLLAWADRHPDYLKGAYPFPVLKGASDKAIYTEEGNHKARMWHDFLHIKYKEDTSVMGETAIAQVQVAQLKSVGAPDDVCCAVFIDIVGQAYYYSNNDKYVVNQIEFVRQVLLGNESYVFPTKEY